MSTNYLKEEYKPILVTGSHRSGTTWVGSVLARAPRTAYVYEPFNVGVNRYPASPIDTWFQYVCEDNRAAYESYLSRRIGLVESNAGRITAGAGLRTIARCALDDLRFRYYRMRKYRAIVKDPIALFSAEWLSLHFDMQVLVMIRHPAAFCASLKVMNWQHDFSHFLRQPLLMDRYLHEYAGELEQQVVGRGDIIDQAITLWNCIHHTIRIHRDAHPDWLFVRHEDVSSDPLGGYAEIFQLLNLEFTQRVSSYILKSSGTHNPVEQRPGSEYFRDSRRNVMAWKGRLSEREIARINEGTRDVACYFYAESDW